MIGQKEVKKKADDKTKEELVDQIISYETGQLDDAGSLELFAKLIKSGMVWSLQGHYGRMAKELIDNGYIDGEGKILKEIL